MNAPDKPSAELLSDEQQAAIVQLARDAGLSSEVLSLIHI